MANSANGGAQSPWTRKLSADTLGSIYMQSIDQAQGDAPKEIWPELVWAQGQDTQCFLCGVSPLPSSSHIGPNGAPLDSQWWLDPAANATASNHRRLQDASSSSTSSCKFSDVCDASSPGVPGTAQGLLDLAQSTSDEPLQMPPGLETLAGGKSPNTDLFTHELVLHCSGSAGDSSAASTGCNIPDADVKVALKNYLADQSLPHTRRKLTGEADGASFKLDAATAAIHPALMEAVDEDLLASVTPESSDAADCAMSSKYTIFVTSRDRATTSSIVNIFKDLSDNPEKLMAAVSNQTSSPSTICDASMKPKGALFLPSVDTQEGVQHYQVKTSVTCVYVCSPCLF